MNEIFVQRDQPQLKEQHSVTTVQRSLCCGLIYFTLGFLGSACLYTSSCRGHSLQFHEKSKCTDSWVLISSLQDYYSPAMLGLKTDQEVLGELVKMKVPAVAELMERHGVMWTLVVSRWFICLFIDILPVEVIGNMKFSCYTPNYLICTALVIIAYWESRLISILSFLADCAPNMGLFILWRVKDHLPCGLNTDKAEPSFYFGSHEFPWHLWKI